MLAYFPKYFSSKAIWLYIFLVITCSILFNRNSLPVIWICFGLVEVIFFFFFLQTLSRKWAKLPSSVYQKKLLSSAFLIRFIYVVIIYFFYDYMTGQPFEFVAADSRGYHFEALWVVDLIRSGQFDVYLTYLSGSASDMGYPLYLSFIYSIFGDNIIIVRILKAAYSSFTCILIYRVASRNFGEQTGKIAGIIAMLLPNFIYYCGIHLKETEMVFLAVFFIERADFLFQRKRIDYKNLLLCILLGISLFLFRTVLGITAFFSILTVLIFSNNRITGWNKKITIAIWLALFVFILSGSPINYEVGRYWENKTTNLQRSMIHRSSRGNVLAKYGKSSLFFPAMLSVPLPTIVNIETQQNQMLLNGGMYTKNIYVFFVYVALLFLFKKKRYRQHILILSFLLTYLSILALSKFAISERFHMPALPCLVILVSLGITQMRKKNMTFYIPYLLFIAIVIVGWNWFKLAGRGII